MKLFHVSEEADIEIFYPRIPARSDLDKNVGLVWAIDEERLPNFLTPRDCPRVTYHINKNTNETDKKIVDNLWDIADKVKESTLNWSLCRMKNAKPKSNRHT